MRKGEETPPDPCRGKAGAQDEAFDWLERGYQAQVPLLPLKVNHMWDPLHDDPRFQDLLRRMNLEP